MDEEALLRAVLQNNEEVVAAHNNLIGELKRLEQI